MTDTKTQPKPNVVWFDIPAKDFERAVRFYAGVLAIEVQKHEHPGGKLGILPHSDTVAGGCIYTDDKVKPGADGPLVYFNCQGRLDQAIAAVEKLGGKVLQPKQSIAPHGFRAVVLDSEGNRIALHSM